MAARHEPAVAALVGWATGMALPFWATAGFDFQQGRFEERLTLHGERLADVPLRLMSQARQIHTYALAARRGWYPDAAARLVEQAYASMVRDYHGRDDRGGWIFSIRRDGTVADPCRDLYSHAFVLLAIASYVEATGKRQALALADETLAFIERRMTAPQGGGFVEQLPSSGGARRQNPHMHLFEALLALWECSGEARYLALAGRLFDLFTARFFQPDPGIVGEYFTAGLAPAEGLAGKLVEPGHHYEWIWLLRRFERAGRRPVRRYVDALYAHADRYGFDEAGLIVDELLIDGSHHKRSRRIWPIAEAIKANIVEAQRGRAGSSAKAAALAVLLRERFLAADPAGGWFDKLDADGTCLSRFMPASTFYHLIGAIDELDRLVLSASDVQPAGVEPVQGR
jgi:mannose/cellobiose epimerase-like protein (N-acyl-D-glucosamine 2-epimerase family)